MKRVDWFIRGCWIVFTVIVILTVVIGLLWAGECQTTEDDRDQLTISIARCYGLSRDQAILLFAIRDHENGEAAQKEFGIENKESVKDPLQRYCFYACYSANAIKRFCPDTRKKTIKRFNHGFGEGKRRYFGYAVDKSWFKDVMRKMKEYRNINY